MRRSVWISLVSLFTALAVVLNGLTVPAPYAGFLLYGVWEIPVILSLFLVGPAGGVAVAALNALALEFINPGGLPTGPLYNLIAELSMFAGILAAARFTKGRGPLVQVTGATAAGGLARTGVMTIVNFLALPQAYPIGFSIPSGQVPWFLVLIGAFNATVTLYVVPAAFGIMKAIPPRFGGRAKTAAGADP